MTITLSTVSWLLLIGGNFAMMIGMIGLIVENYNLRKKISECEHWRSRK